METVKLPVAFNLIGDNVPVPQSGVFVMLGWERLVKAAADAGYFSETSEKVTAITVTQAGLSFKLDYEEPTT
jgi:hypothetical protein